MSVPARHSHALALLGQAGFERISTAKILVVGAGGIGCELLKNLVLFGFKDIEVIDLDTIDLSNLNRQFLFNKSHIKKSKALIASSTAVSFCPSARITPHHADILKGGPSGAGYEEGARFGADYYAKFDVVLNALDNLEARRHVNKMCVATATPLVESGTAGFIGQVQPILKGTTECYDCVPKETPKSFPVCTIRSTPSTPIHCIVWAKSWLFNQLFGADDETEDQELDKALAEGENAEEISNLRAEAREMSELRQSLLDTTTSARDSASRVFTKIFKGDVERLLSMEDMWKSRRKPVPLVFDEALATSDGETNGSATTGLKDQRTLSLKETVELFEASLAALSARLASTPSDPLSFDKDDTDALDFVTAVANLRARVYHIATLTRFQVKQMAGNIIPAIASTNAIIAGALVLQAVHALNGNWSAARLVNKTGMPRFLVGSKTSTPNPACGVCSEVYVTLKADPAKVTIRDVVKAAKLSREQGGLGMDPDDVEVYDNKRLLADSDFEDNLDKTLAEFEIGVGSVISLVDEAGEKATINMLIEKLPTAPAGQGEQQKAWLLPPIDKLPALLDRAKIPTPPPDSDEDDDVAVVDAPTQRKLAKSSRKRPADEELPNPKKRQGDMSGANAESAIEL